MDMVVAVPELLNRLADVERCFYLRGTAGLMPVHRDTEVALTAPVVPTPMPKEIGGPKGPEPTRYGDWEVNSHCSDF